MNDRLRQFLDILKMVGPGVLAALVPGAAAFAPLIVTAINEAEQLVGATGPEKKAYALELVGVGVTAANAIAKKPLLDTDETKAAVSAGINAVVSTINIVQKAQTVATAPAA
jgi:hypothetical protein